MYIICNVKGINMPKTTQPPPPDLSDIQNLTVGGGILSNIHNGAANGDINYLSAKEDPLLANTGVLDGNFYQNQLQNGPDQTSQDEIARAIQIHNETLGELAKR
jgi:hypothetical protein